MLDGGLNAPTGAHRKPKRGANIAGILFPKVRQTCLNFHIVHIAKSRGMGLSFGRLFSHSPSAGNYLAHLNSMSLHGRFRDAVDSGDPSPLTPPPPLNLRIT